MTERVKSPKKILKELSQTINSPDGSRGIKFFLTGLTFLQDYKLFPNPRINLLCNMLFQYIDSQQITLVVASEGSIPGVAFHLFPSTFIEIGPKTWPANDDDAISLLNLVVAAAFLAWNHIATTNRNEPLPTRQAFEFGEQLEAEYLITAMKLWPRHRLTIYQNMLLKKYGIKTGNE